MAIPWLTLLKTVPWTDVIANAPTVANGAKKLWNSVSGKTPPTAMPPSANDEAAAPGLATLEAEVRALKITTSELHQQMLTSSALIRELAEQNTALIKRVETYRVRLSWLAGGVGVLALLSLFALFALFTLSNPVSAG